jgi:tetratricopeptide (TPR) repeat protein
MIARAYYNMKDYPNAELAFNKLIEADPANVDAQLYLARIASNMDNDNEQGLAFPKFEKLISVIGTDTVKYKNALVEAYTYMGYYYLSAKDYNESREWYMKLQNLDPSNKDLTLTALNSYALIAFRQKNYVEARDYYQEILKLDPNNKQIQQAILDLNKAIAAAQQ